MKKYYCLILVLSMLSINAFSQNSNEQEESIDDYYFFLMYNTKVHGEYYGYGLQSDNIITEISFGGLFSKYGKTLGDAASIVNTSYNERYGFSLDENPSSFQRNFDFTLAYQSDNWKYFYAGLCYSNLTYTYEENNQDQFIYRRASIDPLVGIKYKLDKLHFNLRIGIPLFVWSKYLDTTMFDEASNYYASSPIIVDAIEEVKIYYKDVILGSISPFKGLYIGIIIGYTFIID